ncbi:MAG TPA: DUF1775 domain-containing protein [Solirubrobacteraceae bacterium]|jgi:hypothetical protein|nr:DUF1775 domain-containing protein [Solirubrobacteraceae bacterium]
MSVRTKSAGALGAAVVSAAAVALAVPALSSGHATVSALQPQGPSLTAARGTFVVRTPNEREKQNTWKVVMIVPGPLQQSFSVRQSPDWKIRMLREDTGEKGESGSPIFAIKRVSWTARSKDAEIEPGMFGEWAVRWVNPVAPQQLCFGIAQYYRNVDGTRKRSEIVNWTGDPATADTPRSCIDVVAAPPRS